MIEDLPRREREVFETLCRLGQGATAQVRDGLAHPLSDSAVRTLLSRLEAKGLVQRHSDAAGNIYLPTPAQADLADGALKKMVDTFFAGSVASAATALLGLTSKLKPEEVVALRRAIDEAGGGDQ